MIMPNSPTEYSLAVHFVLNNMVPKVPNQELVDPRTRVPLTHQQFLEGYLHNRWETPPRSLNEVFKRLMFAAQNMRGMGRTIKKLLMSIRNTSGIPVETLNDTKDYVGRLHSVLGGFDPQTVANRYTYDPNERATLDSSAQILLDDIRAQLNPTHSPRTETQSHWPKFCKSIISGSHFLCQFHSPNTGGLTQFHNFVIAAESIDARIALVTQIENSVYNYGFALACGFLRDMGYPEYCKPDTWVILISTCLQLSPDIKNQRQQQVQVFEDICNHAQTCNVTPLAVDKAFWLIGSGNFHFHNVNIGDHTKDFFLYARAQNHPVSPNC
jgi:hypothetical protein